MNQPKTIKEIINNSPLLKQLDIMLADRGGNRKRTHLKVPAKPDLKTILKKKKKEIRSRERGVRQLLKNEVWKMPVIDYFRIPNMFFDAMYRYFPDVQGQLIAYIVRHTWGWRAGGTNRRKWVNVRLKTLAEKLGRTKMGICKARRQLEKKGFIIRKGNWYRIDEHYPGWKKPYDV